MDGGGGNDREFAVLRVLSVLSFSLFLSDRLLSQPACDQQLICRYLDEWLWHMPTQRGTEIRPSVSSVKCEMNPVIATNRQNSLLK